MIDGLKVIEKFESGASSIDKYIVEKENKKCLLRFYDIRFFNDRCEAFKNMEFLYNNGVFVPKVYEYGEFNNKGYSVIEWIDGKPLNELLNNDTDIQNYGTKVAKELLKMHKIYVKDKIDVYKKYLKSLNNRLEKIDKLNININYNEMLSYVNDNINLLKGRDTSIIHGDFHPGNIVISNDKVSFIDLDVCKKGFPWIDLSTNACYMDNPNFYTVVINEYFNGEIPDVFWTIYNLYGILYCLDYLLYCERIKNKNIKDGIDVINQFLSYTNNFKNEKPDWFNDKVLRKEMRK